MNISWYIARSAGLVAWALLTASVLWGLSMSSKAFGKRPKPAWLLDLHRFLGGLATIFTVVHVLGIVGDSYIHFSLASVLVPFASTWRPMAVSLGVVSLWLLLAVELTSLARKQLPRRLWKMTHFASFPLFVFATGHMLTAGTDAHTWLVEWGAVAAVMAVTALTAVRISHESKRQPVAARVPVTRVMKEAA